ncbi:phosphatase PAP2 family protein [Kingella negevensis]|uniref:phosphatase PAP2 family protein n=1 Tax=Kingella negevensis TaxID=1522312 RepID=UPI000694EA73|nr:phosphatase PAP2 family protein [Kingella negevensis]MDK4688219.1 phosphatase PAP2 family protein [Kingella negevensis]WII91840.1 phosphatase PAP2 family protein [Kingella negevensis]
MLQNNNLSDSLKTNVYVKLVVYAALMLLVPIYFWATGSVWTMSDMVGKTAANQAWIGLTYMSSVPYGVITAAILTLCAIGLARGRVDWRVVVLLCAVSQVGTQAIKSGVKRLVKEPRPYVVALHKANVPEQLGYAPDSFYAQTKDTKREMIRATAFDDDTRTVADYQQDELGYSFPSGHTSFAVSWVLLFAGLLCGQMGVVAWGFQAALSVWAAAMLFSRVRLGMHFPIDLFAATLICLAWHGWIFGWVLPKLQKRFQAA